jgi:hypothetical protein
MGWINPDKSASRLESRLHAEQATGAMGVSSILIVWYQFKSLIPCEFCLYIPMDGSTSRNNCRGFSALSMSCKAVRPVVGIASAARCDQVTKGAKLRLAMLGRQRQRPSSHTRWAIPPRDQLPVLAVRSTVMCRRTSRLNSTGSSIRFAAARFRHAEARGFDLLPACGRSNRADGLDARSRPAGRGCEIFRGG